MSSLNFITNERLLSSQSIEELFTNNPNANSNSCNSSRMTVHDSVTHQVTISNQQQKNDEQSAAIITDADTLSTQSALLLKQQQQYNIQQHSDYNSDSLNANSLNVNQINSPLKSSLNSLFQHHQYYQSTNLSANVDISPLSNCQISPISPFISSLSSTSSQIRFSRPSASFFSSAASDEFSISLSCYSASSSSASLTRSIFYSLPNSNSSTPMLSSSFQMDSASNPSVASHSELQESLDDQSACTPQLALPSSSRIRSTTLSNESCDSSASLPFFSSLPRYSSISEPQPQSNAMASRMLAMSPISHESISEAFSSSSAISSLPSSFIVPHSGVPPPASSTSAATFSCHFPSIPISSPVLPVSPTLSRRTSSSFSWLSFNDQLNENDMQFSMQPPALQQFSSNSSRPFIFDHQDSPSTVSLASSPPPQVNDENHLLSTDEMLSKLRQLPQIDDFISLNEQEDEQQRRGRKRRCSSSFLALDSSEDDEDELSTISTPSHHSSLLQALHPSAIINEFSTSSSSAPIEQRRKQARNSSTSSSFTSARSSSENDMKNLKRSQRRCTSKKEERLSSLLALYPQYSRDSTRFLYPAKEYYYHPPQQQSSAVLSNFATSNWIGLPQAGVQPSLTASDRPTVHLQLKKVDEATRGELVLEVDLGVAGVGCRVLLFSAVTIFYEAKSLCTTSSAMRKRAEDSDCAFFDLRSQTLIMRAFPAELALKASAILEAFSQNSCQENDFFIQFSTDGYPLHYRDRVKAKKSEAYASFLLLSAANLYISVIPSKTYPNASIISAAFHEKVNNGKAGKEELLPAKPVFATRCI